MNDSTLKWLIVEDSLEDRKGHWFEYLMGFHRELPRLGDQVTWLVSRRATQDIISSFTAQPILPESAFRKVSDAAPSWRRYLRIPVHGWRTWSAVRKYLRDSQVPDIIFVPTVIVHHLLGWVLLLKLGVVSKESRLLLFFPNLPIRRAGDSAELDGSPTSKLILIFLRAIDSEIRNGRVILGVETEAMKEAAEKVSGLPFTYFPHPVTPLLSRVSDSTVCPSDIITMACYGPARHEKGSDLLIAAIERYLIKNPDSRARFIVQWIEDFKNGDGEIVRISEFLKNNPRVEIVSRFFEEGEYAARLSATQALLLPYRRSSYGLRVSRVVIEAMVNGIPVVSARGTSLAQQAQEFGAAVLCEENDVESLEKAIEETKQKHEELAERARERSWSALSHFSILRFREILVLAK